MKTCISDISTRFLAGLLTASESAEFESHLEHCPHCVQQLEHEAGHGLQGSQNALEVVFGIGLVEPKEEAQDFIGRIDFEPEQAQKQTVPQFIAMFSSGSDRTFSR